MAEEHIVFDFKGAAEQMLKEAFEEHKDEWVEQITNRILSELESFSPRWLPDEKVSDRWKCSECGNTIFSTSVHDRYEFHAFCGRCGAYMWKHNNGRGKKNET